MRAVLIGAIVVVATASGGGTIKLDWSDCGDSSTHGHITSLSPATLTLGTKTTVAGKGTVDETIPAATYKVVAKALGVTVFSHTGDACKPDTIKLPAGAGEIDFKGFACPLSSGSVELDLDITLSSSIPASLARATIDLTATASSGDKALCVEIKTSPAEQSFEEIAQHVNAQKTTWKAEAPSRFEAMDDVKMLCGTVLKSENDYKEYLEEKTEQEIPDEQIPTDFDVRTNWPKCASVSGHIRDQSACGSCWAFGSTEAFNDRRCIATGDTTLLSAEDTTANCGLLQCMSMGCGGGQPGAAWNWFKNAGVVTGGDYDDLGKSDTCGPYTLKACAHHVPATSKYPKCPSQEYSTPSLSKCQNGYAKSYSADKIKASASYSLSGISKIQSDIMQYGSVTAAFTVYSDFPTYKSGVYKHTTGSQLGGHAIKILGWGVESGQDYWLVANSWNEQWGDQGLFKIARGNDECGIESQVSAGNAGSTNVVV